ncbi:MAG: Amino acid transporter, partial [Propionibacterium sp. DORA_15]
MIFGMLLGGLLASCVALAYSELTTLFPRAGGEVVYSYVGLGRRASFTTGWLLIGAYLSSTAFYVTAFGYLLEKIWPNLGSVSLYSVNRESVDMTVLIIGVVLTLIIAAMNWFGVSLSGQIQTVLFVALVVTALVTGSPSNFIPPYRADANALGDTLRFVVPGMT